MQDIRFATIQPETLENVTGGSWLEMLTGGRLNIATLLGGANPRGGVFGVNKEGHGKSVSEGIAGLLFGSSDRFKPIEGRDRPGFGG